MNRKATTPVGLENSERSVVSSVQDSVPSPSPIDIKTMQQNRISFKSSKTDTKQTSSASSKRGNDLLNSVKSLPPINETINETTDLEPEAEVIQQSNDTFSPKHFSSSRIQSSRIQSFRQPFESNRTRGMFLI